jgi:hypothetical protein
MGSIDAGEEAGTGRDGFDEANFSFYIFHGFVIF